jgi:hypothetical protein
MLGLAWRILRSIVTSYMPLQISVFFMEYFTFLYCLKLLDYLKLKKINTALYCRMIRRRDLTALSYTG